ncbi:MAG: hypothetical protein ACREVJ_15225, partial [Gammaproteobacteria bacterium]
MTANIAHDKPCPPRMGGPAGGTRADTGVGTRADTGVRPYWVGGPKRRRGVSRAFAGLSAFLGLWSFTVAAEAQSAPDPRYALCPPDTAIPPRPV